MYCIIVENSLSPRGGLTVSSWRDQCILLFARRTCCAVFVIIWIAQHFHRLMDFPPWKNLSYCCQCYGPTLLPMLHSYFVDLRKIVVTFRLLCLCDFNCCYIHRSTSLLLLFVFPTLWTHFYCILFYNHLCLPM